MNLKKKTNFWVESKLITKEQQREILKKEDKRFIPFILFGILWVGIFCFIVGLSTIIQAHWEIIPKSIKISSFFIMALGVIFTLIISLKNHKKTIFEIALFISFLMIGGGIGLSAQLFNFQLASHQGLLLWALLSLVIVLFSKKEFLFLLWIPLFLGGIIGYLKLELLLLFFEQSPIFSTSLMAGLLLIAIYILKNFNSHYLSACYKWSIILYIMVVCLGDRSMMSVFSGFLLFCFFMLILLALAIKERRILLFNTVSFFVILRLIILYFELSSDKHITGLGFLILGSVILLLSSIFVFIEKRISKKDVLLLKNNH